MHEFKVVPCSLMLFTIFSLFYHFLIRKRGKVVGKKIKIRLRVAHLKMTYFTCYFTLPFYTINSDVKHTLLY